MCNSGDAGEVRLREDEHFYTQKEIILIVNAQRKPWTKTSISYDQVTHLAFPEPPPPGVVITYTVEYERGPHRNREGSLTVGHSVFVKNGMIFVVTETGRSSPDLKRLRDEGFDLQVVGT